MAADSVSRSVTLILAAILMCPALLGAQVEGRALKAVLGARVAEAISSYQMWDATNRDGIGNSDRTTSGSLGWGESAFLRNYMLCYHVTRDTYWLDKLIDHFDRMIGNLSDLDGDGYLAWSDTAYSVGIIEAEPDGDVGDLTIEPPLQRPYVNRGGELVTGHEYRIEFVTETSVRVRDVTANETVASHDHAAETVVEAIPGAKLTIKGPGKAGVAFRVTATKPESVEYQVHDGMVTYPVAQFIEAVYTTADPDPKYRAKAEEYAALLHKHFYEKWERTWLDLPDGAGLYKFTPNVTQRFPDTSLPHNQYLALARTWVVLKDVPGLEHRDEYLDRATRMARYFHKHLQLSGNAYVWNYWDPLPEEEGIGRHIEDHSHATIDIGFAVEATKRGVVFTEQDLQRFAATYADVMWNGSLEDPRIGARVDTNEGDARTWSEWIQLGVVSETVCDIAAAVYEATGRSPSMAPQLVYLYDEVIGLKPEERAACVRAGEQVRQMLAQGELINPGFEIGPPGTGGPFGWTLTTWTPDEGGSTRWVDDAHSGQRAIALIGGSDKANVVAQPIRRLTGRSGQQVTLRAYYRTAGGAVPGFSILGLDDRGERVQYDSSGALPASEEWRLGSWTVELAQGVVEFSVILRNHGKGTVLYDDVSVDVD